MAISDIRGPRREREGVRERGDRAARVRVRRRPAPPFFHSQPALAPASQEGPVHGRCWPLLTTPSLSIHLTVLAALALAFSLGLALQGAACYANYWPLLTALAYLLFPMPSLFFSETAPGVAKWLTGFSQTAAAGIVATLWHAGWVPGKAAVL